MGCPTWSSAKPPNLDFVDILKDLELREASSPRFRRQFRGIGAPRNLWTSISPTVSRISSSAGRKILKNPQIAKAPPYPHICRLDARWGAKAPHLARVSSLSARPGAPRRLSTTISSTLSTTCSTTEPPNFNFVDNFEAEAPHLARVSARGA